MNSTNRSWAYGGREYTMIGRTLYRADPDGIWHPVCDRSELTDVLVDFVSLSVALGAIPVLGGEDPTRSTRTDGEW